MSVYPEGWPRCICCYDYALDGHLTCGRVECQEAEARVVYETEDRGSRCTPACGWCGACS